MSNNEEELSNSIMAIRYKMVFVGDICVGKTSIMNRFISNEFQEEYDVIKNFLYFTFFKIQATIGVDFSTKIIEFRDNTIKLQIWDSAGQERYKALIPSYVRGASIIFIIYDISDHKSFLNIESWINFIKQVNTDESLLVLCGNKNDLERQVNYKDGYELAQKNGMMFFETSAKNCYNINLMMFTTIAKLPFFSQFEIDKDDLIKELEKINGKEGNVVEEKKNDLNIKQEDNNNNQVQPTKILIRKRKQNCCC